MMPEPLRLRKSLEGPLQPAVWPAGFKLVQLAAARPKALHQLLADAYANGFGTVADFDRWWTGLTEDAEFDPALVFIVADAAGEPVGLAQCWTSGFVKDIAIAEAHRRKGLAEALLRTTFAAFKARGADHVDLKVERANADAQRLYARVGMLEARL